MFNFFKKKVDTPEIQDKAGDTRVKKLVYEDGHEVFFAEVAHTNYCYGSNALSWHTIQEDGGIYDGSTRYHLPSIRWPEYKFITEFDAQEAIDVYLRKRAATTVKYTEIRRYP